MTRRNFLYIIGISLSVPSLSKAFLTETETKINTTYLKREPINPPNQKNMIWGQKTVEKFLEENVDFEIWFPPAGFDRRFLVRG